MSKKRMPARKEVSRTATTLPKKLNILGQEFEVILDKINKDNSYGYCYFENGQIVIFIDDTIKSYQGFDILDTLCHEIVHATLERSGLTHNSNPLIGNALDETLCTQLGRVFSENLSTIAALFISIKEFGNKKRPKKKNKPTKVIDEKEQTE